MTAAPNTKIMIWMDVTPSESGAVQSAAQQLVNQLHQPQAPVQIGLRNLSGDRVSPANSPQVAILSLQLMLLNAQESLDSTYHGWVSRIQKLQQSGVACVVCNVFRHIEDRQPGRPQDLSRRILELNLMAVKLSQQTGASVADLDRAMGWVGGGFLGSDYRIGTGRAALLAGHTIARTVLMDALQDQLDLDDLDRAVKSLGSLREIILRMQATHKET